MTPDETRVPPAADRAAAGDARAADPAEQRAMVEQQIEALTARARRRRRRRAAAAVAARRHRAKYLTYRGDIQAAVGVGGALAFVTVHPEGQPTALYRLDADKLTPDRAAAAVRRGRARGRRRTRSTSRGTDRRVYESRQARRRSRSASRSPAASPRVVPVAGDRLAVLNGTQIDIVSRADGAVLQTLDLPEDGHVPRRRPHRSVARRRHREGDRRRLRRPGQAPSSSRAEAERLHDGAVTALLFEPEELRFFSAGADHKLLTTHARGRLEPEDKGRGNNHKDLRHRDGLVPAGDRFFTGSRDATLKTWPRAGGGEAGHAQGRRRQGRRAGRRDGLQPAAPRGRAATTTRSASSSSTPTASSATSRSHEVYGAVDRAKNELPSSTTRSAARRRCKDARRVERRRVARPARRADRHGPDHQLRLLAAQLLAASPNPRAVGKLLEAGDRPPATSKVRVAAFQGLQQARSARPTSGRSTWR